MNSFLRIAAWSGGGVAIIVAGILGFAATRPDSFTVQRSAGIQAAPEKIQPLLADLRRHRDWSPWEQMDPGMSRSYSGAPRGVGQVYDWDSRGDVGQGRLAITEATPERVVMTLDFIRPFAAHNTVTFTLAPAGGTTTVTWAMTGAVPYPAKVMHLFIDPDAMVGGAFQQGLASLKALAES
jgi:hypothetical protein